VGRWAIELQPDDAWGAHAVAHVFETRDRAAEGLAFLDALEPQLAHCNNFAGHLAWHRSLFHLQLGEHDAALALHDTKVAPHLGRDYRDLCNASSLLWRLENDGVSVGSRWQALAELARRASATTRWPSPMRTTCCRWRRLASWRTPRSSHARCARE